MMSEILMRISMLHKELPEEEFEVDLAVETAIEDVEREVTDEERETLDDMMPEWLEDDGETEQTELVTDGGQHVQTVSADFLTGSCPNCEEPAEEPVEFVPREIECSACGEVWRLVR